MLRWNTEVYKFKENVFYKQMNVVPRQEAALIVIQEWISYENWYLASVCLVCKQKYDGYKDIVVYFCSS